jgi:hypothetical protein
VKDFYRRKQREQRIGRRISLLSSLSSVQLSCHSVASATTKEKESHTETQRHSENHFRFFVPLYHKAVTTCSADKKMGVESRKQKRRLASLSSCFRDSILIRLQEKPALCLCVSIHSCPRKRIRTMEYMDRAMSPFRISSLIRHSGFVLRRSSSPFSPFPPAKENKKRAQSRLALGSFHA